MNEWEELPEQKDTGEFAALLAGGTVWDKKLTKAYLKHQEVKVDLPEFFH